jgi:hypothetical protein
MSIANIPDEVGHKEDLQALSEDFELMLKRLRAACQANLYLF